MSLADELLADLEEKDQDDLDDLMDAEEAEQKEEKPDLSALMEYDTTQITSVTELCKLRDSSRLRGIMQQIKKYQDLVRKSSDIIGIPLQSHVYLF